MDLNAVPYPIKDGVSESIYTAQLYEHLSLNSMLFFNECYRILKPDGVLEIHTPNMFSIKNRCYYLFGRIDSSPDWNPYHVKLAHPLFLLRLLRQIGFDAKLAYKRYPAVPLHYLFSNSICIRARKRR
jgi:predicted SAM-dependent methyltransferase